MHNLNNTANMYMYVTKQKVLCDEIEWRIY